MSRLLLVLITLSLSVGQALALEEKEVQPTPPASAVDSTPLPGVALAEGISQVTGVAISPLLGVSAVGIWRYFRTPAEFRQQLPWFCHPAAWGFGLGLLGVCFLKDLLGTATPPLLKKPLDLLEFFENKLSGVVASGAIIPLIAAQVAHAFADSPGGSTSLPADVHYATMLPGFLAFIDPRFFFVPFALFAFAVVWVTSHAVNVLILLSPFGFVDALLKLLKTGVLSGLAAACLINPFLGAAISLLIILVAAWFAPYAFRLTLFGTLVAGDILLASRARRLARPQEPHVFTSRKLCGIPARIFGRLTRTPNGELQFTYRPWLILPRRTVTVPGATVTIERGVLYPSLLQSSGPSAGLASIFDFLPRYCGQERAVADALAPADVREHAFARGFQAVRVWLAEVFGGTRGTLVQLKESPAT